MKENRYIFVNTLVLHVYLQNSKGGRGSLKSDKLLSICYVGVIRMFLLNFFQYSVIALINTNYLYTERG